MKTFYFFIIIITILIGIVIIKDKETKLFEFFVTKTNTTKSHVSITPPKKVTIASLKNTLDNENNVKAEVDDVNDVNDEDTEDTEDNESSESSQNKDIVCPEGYAYVNKKCREVCHNCKLGTCEYGICY